MADPKSRTITLIRSPDDRGVFVFRIISGRETSFYVAREIRCEIGGRGFAIHRLGMGELLHTRVGKREDCSCECLGFLRHGYCRHIQGLLALIKQTNLTTTTGEANQ